MRDLLAPFPWYGGKRRWAQSVNAALGKVDVYVEPFAGSLAVLLQREPAPREIVCDLDGMVVNFWRAIAADPEQVAYWGDAPTYHHELTARRNWLARWAAETGDWLSQDPDHWDARAAGYWCWCVTNWIGGVSDMLLVQRDQIPYVQHYAGGQGVQVQLDKRPHVQGHEGGQGVQVQLDKRPYVSGRGAWLLPWFERLASRLRGVVVLNRAWQSSLTDTLLWQTPSCPPCDVGILLDPPYVTGNRDPALYGSEDGDNPALESWAWAVEHGEKHRIAYACHYGDFEPPPGWRMETMSMTADRTQGKADCMMFSPACLGQKDLFGGLL